VIDDGFEAADLGVQHALSERRERKVPTPFVVFAASQLLGGSDQPQQPNTSSQPATASRSCLACTTPLDPAWSHCPRCGAAAPGDAKSQESR